MKIDDTLPASLPRWPAAFNQVPKWAFEDADVFALEHERIFRGPVWPRKFIASLVLRCVHAL